MVYESDDRTPSAGSTSPLGCISAAENWQSDCDNKSSRLIEAFSFDYTNVNLTIDPFLHMGIQIEKNFADPSTFSVPNGVSQSQKQSYEYATITRDTYEQFCEEQSPSHSSSQPEPAIPVVISLQDYMNAKRVSNGSSSKNSSSSMTRRGRVRGSSSEPLLTVRRGPSQNPMIISPTGYVVDVALGPLPTPRRQYPPESATRKHAK